MLAQNKCEINFKKINLLCYEKSFNKISGIQSSHQLMRLGSSHQEMKVKICLNFIVAKYTRSDYVAEAN